MELYEISCVTVPANDDAGVLDVKAGRRNRKSDADILRQIRSLVDQLLEDEVEDTDDNGKDDAKANTEVEEQKQSNPEIEELIKKSNEILRRNQR